MPPTIISDVLGTGNIQSAQRIVDMDDIIHELDPNATALTALLMKLSKKPAINPKFDQLTDEFRPLDDALDDVGGAAAGDLVWPVDNSSYFRPGDIVHVPKTKENVLVVSIATTDLTVVRAFGETTAAALIDDEPLKIIGNAFEEGAGKPAIRTTKKGTDFNYTEIFREPFGTTRTEENSATYGNEGLANLRKKHAIEHMLQIERAFWFGERKEDTGGSHPKRTTRGVLRNLLAAGSGATTVDAAGTFSETEMETFMRNLFRYGSDTKFLFASRLAMSVISQFAQGKLQMFPEDQVYGIAITSYLSPHGMAKLITNNLFDGTGPDEEYGGWMVGLDLADLTYRFLTNSDTKLYVNRQANDIDGVIDEYLTECGLQLNHPRFHGYVKGITG